MSQKQRILEALQAGERLTPLRALERFQCMTLAQRVSELRRAGHPINDRLVQAGVSGQKRVAEYWMEVNHA